MMSTEPTPVPVQDDAANAAMVPGPVGIPAVADEVAAPTPEAAVASPNDDVAAPVTEAGVVPATDVAIDSDAIAANASEATPAPTEARAPQVAAPTLDPAAVAILLRKHFPALFGGQPKPIKLHIQADIQARTPGLLSKRSLSAFLHRHTGSTSYLMALSRAEHRFDLDGQPAGELTAEHREVASQELARRRALQDERRALERQQQVREREEHDLLRQQRFNRAGLLRDFETTTLTRANFCALKGMKDAALESLLVQAREERKLAPPPQERERERERERPVERDRDRPPQGPRRDDRGPRSGPRSGPHSGRPPR